ncbi:MAG: sigma 54-interacting transcriptional regulator [Deltaproteobacteria bacterium]|nr:sigma 54-interacting transcriptional regulator [Deltaproteobacteria bacterium]MBW1922061.1 sigma 54-interacting transcriptional regulator [Deltaproteobacteria bacterium]MBW1949816.1 sigma 54-interacting transcriptional regulator [Deltaproteobacteria bacterium]MBW2007675.1 sigma 54-interacting transcriptional regulator [Deltaproteobacteria bacterium]MBW2103534.1 sigma 54-interacting transcriptional regulator [Deltaproteobacteria bacterium]
MHAGNLYRMEQAAPLSDSTIDRLREISHWVSSVLDLDQLLELIIETATRMMRAKASSLLLLDRKSGKLRFKVATGEKGDEVRRFEVNLGQGIAGYVAQKGEPLLIPDVTKDARWYKKISESTGFQTRSIACVPMRVEDETIGVVEIIDKEDGSPIGREDMKLLTVFADLASMAISNARKIDRFKRENEDLKQELQDRYRIIGESAGLRKVISDALKVANSKTTTLIQGESGTGKELLARLIHRAGPRKNQPMIVLNCAALPETLLEAELFGYERGAFTGATSRKIGKVELADGGTLFLDEIGEMTPGMQAKLLRVIQEGMFYRVGGTTPIKVDVRFLSATNRDIAKEVSEGRFREDLFYRLNVVQIHMPALRERKEDIPLLAHYFLERFQKERGLHGMKISPEAMRRMKRYDWPGNVRELANAVERAVVMGNGIEIRPEDLPIAVEGLARAGSEVGLTLKEAVDNFKKDFIRLNLRHTGGNRSHAARLMGIQRTYLSRMLTKYGIRDA